MYEWYTWWIWSYIYKHTQITTHTWTQTHVYTVAIWKAAGIWLCGHSFLFPHPVLGDNFQHFIDSGKLTAISSNFVIIARPYSNIVFEENIRVTLNLNTCVCMQIDFVSSLILLDPPFTLPEICKKEKWFSQKETEKNIVRVMMGLFEKCTMLIYSLIWDMVLILAVIWGY